VEASVHGSLDKEGKNENGTYQGGGMAFLALPALLAIMLIGLAILQPAASSWISEAVQAEVAAFNAMPELSPTQLARPDMEIRTVRAE
jgi:hypothetical protein